MGPAPWWVTLIIGALTVVGAVIGARMGATSTREATRQRERADAREEWFRRVEWAAAMTLSDRVRTQAAGSKLLSALADSALATQDDLKMLMALNVDESLDQAEVGLAQVIGETDFDQVVDESQYLPDDEQEQEAHHVD